MDVGTKTNENLRTSNGGRCEDQRRSTNVEWDGWLAPFNVLGDFVWVFFGFSSDGRISLDLNFEIGILMFAGPSASLAISAQLV